MLNIYFDIITKYYRYNNKLRHNYIMLLTYNNLYNFCFEMCHKMEL